MQWTEFCFADHGAEIECSVCYRLLVPDENDPDADRLYMPNCRTDEEIEQITSQFNVGASEEVSICHRCLESDIVWMGHNGSLPFVITEGVPSFADGEFRRTIEGLAQDFPGTVDYHTEDGESFQLLDKDDQLIATISERDMLKYMD